MGISFPMLMVKTGTRVDCRVAHAHKRRGRASRERVASIHNYMYSTAYVQRRGITINTKVQYLIMNLCTALIRGFNPLLTQLPLPHLPIQRCSLVPCAGRALANPTSPVDLPKETGKEQPGKPPRSCIESGHNIPARLDIDAH